MSHFVNSEAIFSTIGDYPVVDQYDILYSSLQAGTTYDNYITGSFLKYSTNFFTGKVTLIEGKRALVFNKLSVDRNQLPNKAAFSVGERSRSYDLQPWRERAGIIRNVKIFSNDERYYDSLVPSLYDMYKFNGGDLSSFLRSPGGWSLRINLSDYAGSLIGQMRMFPFEPIFSKAKRVKKPEGGFKTTAAGFETLKLKLLPQMFDMLTGYPFITGGDAYVDTNSDGDISRKDIPPGLTESDAAKVLFGFGDLYDIYSGSFTPGLYKGYNYLPTFRSGSYRIGPVGSGETGTWTGPIIRGWRYGLMDGMPHYTSCIFRRDRYGQYRDMLEQRLNTAFLIDEENSPTNYPGAIEAPATPPVKANNVNNTFSTNKNNNLNKLKLNGLFDAPLKVGFVKQTIYSSNSATDNTDKLVYETVQPINTWSSNLSTYATSSLPYFDDKARNRPLIITPPNSIVVTTLADTFGRPTII